MAGEPQGTLFREGLQSLGPPIWNQHRINFSRGKMGLCIKEKTPILCPLPLIAWPEEDLGGSCLVWGALSWETAMTAKAQPWDAPFPELVHQRKDLITKLPEKDLKPRGKDAARFSGCPPIAKQNCLERSTNCEILAEEVQILNSGCPYMCSVPHEHLNTGRTCGNLRHELCRRSGWAIPGGCCVFAQ